MSIFSGLMFLYFTNIFSILGVSIFHILGDIKNLVFFRCSGNFCLLMLEWTRNALLFLSNICLFWDTVFLGILKNLFFQLFGHFMSTHASVDVECPIFFLVRHFSILGLSVFGDIKKPFFQLFGHFMSTHV